MRLDSPPLETQRIVGSSATTTVDRSRSAGTRPGRDGLHAPFRIAYVIQNAGNDLSEDIGQAALIKATVRFLKKAGHSVDLFKLQAGTVHWIAEIENPDSVRLAPLGMSGTTAFRLFESGVRRIQRELKLPYLALFDSFRFYEACFRCLPQFTICHEYGGLFSVGAAVACRRRRIPYILHVDADSFLENAVAGSPIRGMRRVVAARAARLSHSLADRIICVSNAAKRRLAETWKVDPSKIEVIPNGVDTRLFRPDYDPRPVRHKFGLENDPVVAFVGGFQPWHGLDLLLDGFAAVRRRVPRARLLLAGDGRTRRSVEEKISRLSLNSAVTITGLLPQSEIPRVLAAADVAVAPYPRLPREMWFSPLKLYEYMACGKAIVASRSGQTAEVIQDGANGLLVTPGDSCELSQAILRLLNHRRERLKFGANARKCAVSSHSWDRYVQRLERVYSAVSPGIRSNLNRSRSAV